MTDHQRATGRLRPLLSGVMLRTQTDQRLTALARAGHQQAFAAIFERYGRELRSHAARVVRADGVDDVVQQAMLGSWAALLSGAEVADLRAWLHRIVHNTAVSAVTRRGYDDVELPASSVAPALTEDLADGPLTLAEALAVIAALPDSQRRALTLTAIEGRSGRVAAQEMGLSENAMRQLVHRARTGVRSAMSVVMPLPLLGWIGDGGGGAAPALVRTGAAGGLAVSAVKLAAVIGVTGAALGGVHALQTRHQWPFAAGHAHHEGASSATGRAPGSRGIAASPAATSLRFGWSAETGKIQPASFATPVTAPARRVANDNSGSGASHASLIQGAGHANGQHGPRNSRPQTGDESHATDTSHGDGALHQDGASSGNGTYGTSAPSPSDGEPRPQSNSPGAASHPDGNGPGPPPPGGTGDEASSSRAAATDLQSTPAAPNSPTASSPTSPTSASSSSVPAGGQDHPAADTATP